MVTRGFRMRAGLAAALVVTTLASGCGLFSGEPTPPLGADKVVDPKLLEGVNTQEPEWEPCEEDQAVQCTQITVPLNYGDPGGDSITLTMNRLRTTEKKKSQRLGTLVIGPTSAGEFGRGILFSDKKKFEALRSRYDLVAFDPRGAGGSVDLECTADKDRFYQNDFTPDTDEEKKKVAAALKSYAESCTKDAEKILPHLGAENISRDLDVIRASLRQKKLNYLGYSFGTLVGQRYAAQFPKRVGRIVLDSVEDPALSTEKVTTNRTTPASDASKHSTPTTQIQTRAASTVQRAAEHEKALSRIFARCVAAADGPCPIGGTPKEVMTAYDKLLADLEKKPIPAADDRTLTESLARLAGAAAATSPDRLGPVLTRGIAEARDGHGQFLLSLADTYLARDLDGTYARERDYTSAARCLVGDTSVRRATPSPTATPGRARLAKAIDAAAVDTAKAAPHFGRSAVYLGELCAFWPTAPTSEPEGIESDTKAPILLANKEIDAVTPLAGAERVKARIPSAQIVVAKGEGHGAYRSGNKCVDSAVNDFFLGGKSPAKTMNCD